jgi:hypothetical protein
VNDSKPVILTNELRVRLFHEFIFSLYSSLLFLWLNAQVAKIPLVVTFQHLIAPGRSLHSFLDTSLQLAIGLLWVSSTAVIFGLLQLLRRSSSLQFVFRTVAGIVAIGGFALAYLYARWSLPWALDLLLVVLAVACVLLYLVGGWPLSAPWSLMLLSLYFAFWTLRAWTNGGPGWLLLWPGWNTNPVTREHPNIIYPVLGYCSTIIWAFYVKTRQENRI